MQTLLDTSLSSFARADLLQGPTPIQRAERLEHLLGLKQQGIGLFLKRDDHMLIGGGGNKLRKLEFHIGAALAAGVDTVITVGGIQSNHARLTAAVCARLGLACELILTRAVPKNDVDYELNGNVLLDQLFGAQLQVLAGGSNSLAVAETRATQLRDSGRNVLVIPTGGSTPLGSLGYARCAAEIAQQETELGLSFNQVVVPNGSAGTHAGLAAGFQLLGRGTSIVKSYSVLSDRDTSATRTRQLTEDALTLLGSSAVVQAEEIDIDGSQLGDGYGLPTPAMQEAVRLMARAEGLLIDPVYSGKAFAGLLADLRHGRYRSGDNVLFVMTGGTPGLYAYRDIFQS
ncbi:D-cysteine desulfhydrase [Pseudomonas sp. 478]|uniref:D-cysteine desulfhydrase family protein n=1 Tax=unclassified Pseudomonas TaxID=196821 RepID=UPI000DACED94|nr:MULTISPECIES: D-cysteine desulfhydrase family protein [unclassified Pseudomonas]PZW90445.1 D-cysteine desulfhydrase [Pseudomonas sp. 478]TCV46126.1 D-cysteine desulfhydrase [Pseudomonas sp. 460]